MQVAAVTETDNLQKGAVKANTTEAQAAQATQAAEDDEDRGRISLHPQGGSDLRLLAGFNLHAAHALRTHSFAMAQAIRSKRAASR